MEPLPGLGGPAEGQRVEVGLVGRAPVKRMHDKHRRFLISFGSGTPDWSLLAVPKADKLPAVRWRRHNLDILPAKRRLQAR